MKFLQKTITGAILLLVLLVLPVVGFATDGKYNLHQVGIMPTNTFNNFIWNDILYNQEGYTVRCYDISPGVNLAGMTYKDYEGEILYQEKVQSLYVSGGRLYVTTGHTFSIASLADKLHPAPLGTLTSTGSFNDVVVVGNVAYVSGSHLWAIDVSDPTKPRIITEYGNGIGKLVTDGKYIYGVHGIDSTQFTIYDVTTPGSPVYASNLTFSNISNPTYGFGYIAYRDNTVYLPQYNAKNLFAVDVSNRKNPVELSRISTFTTGQGPVGVDVVDNYLYLSLRYKGLEIYDISSRIPKRVGRNTVSTGYSEEISSNGKVTVLSGNSGGTFVYNTANKTKPVSSTHLNVPSSAYVLEPTTIGTIDVLAHAGRNLGSWYWNITDPETASLSKPLTEWSVGEPRMYDIPWFGNYSYTSMGSNGVGAWIVNLTGIEKPGFVPHAQAYGMSSNDVRIYATDSRIYVSSAPVPSVGIPQKFRIYDNTLKDTADPKLLSATNNLTAAYTELIPYHTNYLLATKGNNILVLNITTDVPAVENTFDIGPSTLKNRLAYEPDVEKVYVIYSPASKDYLKALDVSDKDAIHWEAGSISLPIQARAITSNGTDVFIVGRNVGTGNMQMYDFTNLAAPRLVDYATSIDGDCDNTAFYKGYVYCGGFGAITIYKVIPSARTTK